MIPPLTRPHNPARDLACCNPVLLFGVLPSHEVKASEMGNAGAAGAARPLSSNHQVGGGNWGRPAGSQGPAGSIPRWQPPYAQAGTPSGAAAGSPKTAHSCGKECC